MSQVFERLFPQASLSALFQHNIRRDGRSFQQHRDISVEYDPLPTLNSSAHVSLGNTKVVCGITFQQGLPDIIQQQHGVLHIDVTCPPTAGQHIFQQHKGATRQLCSDLSHKILQLHKQHQWFDLSRLYISENLVWHVYFDLVIVSEDGNVFAAALYAIQHALTLLNKRYNDNAVLFQRHPIEIEQFEPESSAVEAANEQHNFKQQHKHRAMFNSNKATTSVQTIIAPITISLNTVDENFQQLGGILPSAVSSSFDINAISLPELIRLRQSYYPIIPSNLSLFPISLSFHTLTELKNPAPAFISATDADQLDNLEQEVAIETTRITLYDPTHHEEHLAESKMTIIFNQRGETVFIDKTSGMPMSTLQLVDIMQHTASLAGTFLKEFNKQTQSS